MSHRRKKNTNTRIIILVIVFLCAMCCIGIAFINLLNINPIPVTPIPTPFSEVTIPTIIAQTAAAAQIQTMEAASPTSLPSPLPTITLDSSNSIETTPTIFIFELQTNVARPTEYIYVTNTPFVLSTQIPPASVRGVCSCSGDTLNCSDFSSQSSAQTCYDFCKSTGVGDIHVLDGNNDGIACESLP
jgi:hypothetical protein